MITSLASHIPKFGFWLELLPYTILIIKNWFPYRHLLINMPYLLKRLNHILQPKKPPRFTHKTKAKRPLALIEHRTKIQRWCSDAPKRATDKFWRHQIAILGDTFQILSLDSNWRHPKRDTNGGTYFCTFQNSNSIFHWSCVRSCERSCEQSPEMSPFTDCHLAVLSEILMVSQQFSSVNVQ